MHAATVANKKLDARGRAYDADAAVRVRAAFPTFNAKNNAGAHGITVPSQNEGCTAHEDMLIQIQQLGCFVVQSVVQIVSIAAPV